MLATFTRLGGAAVISLGLVVATGDPAIAPMAFRADVELTTTVLAMGGLGYETIETDLIKRVLGGRYANEESLVGLPWPGQLTPFNGTLTLNESVAAGLETMDAAIRSTAGPKIVAGASGSTLVVDEEMRRLVNDPTAPPADELSFVVLGDANRGIFKQLRGVKVPILDYTVPEMPVTKYNVTVVTGEYDGMGDWPDRPWNLLADFNALTGMGLLQQIVPQEIVDALKLEAFGSVHYDAMFADLTQIPTKNVTTTVNVAGGVTTTYVVPTADLPMLRPLKALGVPQQTIDTLQAVLRPIIDSAYARNDPSWLKPAIGPSNAMSAQPAATGTVTRSAAAVVTGSAGSVPSRPSVGRSPSSAAASATPSAGPADSSPPLTASVPHQKPSQSGHAHRGSRASASRG